jgi:hypothetical protein
LESSTSNPCARADSCAQKQAMERCAILIGTEVSSLWEWLLPAPRLRQAGPATIPSRQTAFAEGYGGHEMSLPQKKVNFVGIFTTSDKILRSSGGSGVATSV